MPDYNSSPSTHIIHPDNSAEVPPREHRRKAFKAGIISYQNHSLTVDCVIRDMSSSGAKLQFAKSVIVPEHFTLTIPMEGQRVDCLVRWRKANVIGAEFIGDMEQDARNARKQSLDIEYVISKKQSILKK